MRALAVIALLALAAAAPVPRRPAAHAPATGRDWSQVAVRLPSGTMLQGNPQAKVKLVEYLSLTCPHCGHMATTAVPPLTTAYIRTGRVSYEVRPASRDPVDLVAFVLSRCNGPRGFFATIPALYAKQEEWVTKGYAFLQSAPSPEGKSNVEIMKTVANASGLDGFFAARGLPAARQAACYASPDAALISKMAGTIWTPDFPGTPLFEINGKRIGSVGSWDELKAKLVAAGA